MNIDSSNTFCTYPNFIQPQNHYTSLNQQPLYSKITSQNHLSTANLHYEEISVDSSYSTQLKLSSSPLIHPCQQIDLISNEMEEENPSALSLESQMKSQNTICIVQKEKILQLAKQSNFQLIPNQNQMKITQIPSAQYIYYLSGEMYIDLRWVMQNTEDEILNSEHVTLFKQCPKTFTLKQNKTLMVELEGKQQQLFKFQFLPQMLYSLGTALAMKLGKLLEQYQEYVNVKRKYILLRKKEIQSIDLAQRRNTTFNQAQSIISKLNPNEFTCSYIGFGDDVDFYHQKAQCFSPSLLEVLGISAEEMTKISLRKGSTAYFDWKTQLNMTLGRLMLIKNENTQRNWSSFDGEIITFDGFKLKAMIIMQHFPLNENLFPYYPEENPNTQKFLLIDYLVVMKFSFHPIVLKQLMNYRQSSVSKEYKSNILEEELQESVLSSIFLEKYYEKELESLGQKKKKIRKTKAKAIEELNYFSKLQKNKYTLSHS